MELRRLAACCESYRARADRRSRGRAGQSRLAARAEYADAGRLLVCGAQGRRRRRHHDAALPRRRAALHDREGAGQARPLRRRLRDELDRACDAFGGVDAAYFRTKRVQAIRSSARGSASHGRFCQRRNGGRGRRADRLHVGYDRNAESGDALSSRSAGHLRYVCVARAAAAARRSVLRQSAARHSRSGWAVCSFPALRRRGDAAARARRSGRAARAIAEYGVTTMFTAPIAYRTMAGARSLRPLDAAHVRLGRRNAAEDGVGRVARKDRPEDSRRNREHRDAAHLHRFAGRRSARRARPDARFRATSPRSTTTTAARFRTGRSGVSR